MLPAGSDVCPDLPHALQVGTATEHDSMALSKVHVDVCMCHAVRLTPSTLRIFSSASASTNAHQPCGLMDAQSTTDVETSGGNSCLHIIKCAPEVGALKSQKSQKPRNGMCIMRMKSFDLPFLFRTFSSVSRSVMTPNLKQPADQYF